MVQYVHREVQYVEQTKHRMVQHVHRDAQDVDQSNMLMCTFRVLVRENKDVRHDIK